MSLKKPIPSEDSSAPPSPATPPRWPPASERGIEEAQPPPANPPRWQPVLEIPSEDSSAQPSPASPPVWKPVLEMPLKDSSAPPFPTNAPRWPPASEPSIEADDKNQSKKQPVSMRKVEANRQNALKSTGPRTPKGKEYTGRNAIKHGLLVSPTRDFRALDEDPQEYEDLLNGLWDQHQPVGRAEELEVERIAQCWWRLKRAWRYENAGNLGARRTLETRMPLLQKNHGKELDQREAAVILQLRRAQKEIQDTGEISQALRQRIVALMPALEGVWLTIDKDAQERAKVLEAAEGQKLSSQTRSLIVASTVTELTAMVEHMGKLRWSTEVATGQQAIPGFALLDCLLRYEAATDRILNRALDRLERLQRRRKDKEERIPRSESLRLTQ